MSAVANDVSSAVRRISKRGMRNLRPSCDYHQQISHLARAHTHTHTRLTTLFPRLPGWAGTRKVKPIWILLKQETVSGSGISWDICKSAPRSRQITTPAPHHSVFYRPDALPAAQPTASKHWRHSIAPSALETITFYCFMGYISLLTYYLLFLVCLRVTPLPIRAQPRPRRRRRRPGSAWSADRFAADLDELPTERDGRRGDSCDVASRRVASGLASCRLHWISLSPAPQAVGPDAGPSDDSAPEDRSASALTVASAWLPPPNSK